MWYQCITTVVTAAFTWKLRATAKPLMLFSHGACEHAWKKPKNRSPLSDESLRCSLWHMWLWQNVCFAGFQLYSGVNQLVRYLRDPPEGDIEAFISMISQCTVFQRHWLNKATNASTACWSLKWMLMSKNQQILYILKMYKIYGHVSFFTIW